MTRAALHPRLRGVIERRHLTDRCEVHRIALDQETGAQTDTVVATVGCSVQASGLTPRDLEIAGRVGVLVAWDLTVPAGTDVTPEDRIKDLTLGTEYEVVAALGPTTVEAVRRVICVEVS